MRLSTYRTALVDSSTLNIEVDVTKASYELNSYLVHYRDELIVDGLAHHLSAIGAFDAERFTGYCVDLSVEICNDRALVETAARVAGVRRDNRRGIAAALVCRRSVALVVVGAVAQRRFQPQVQELLKRAHVLVLVQKRDQLNHRDAPVHLRRANVKLPEFLA